MAEKPRFFEPVERLRKSVSNMTEFRLIIQRDVDDPDGAEVFVDGFVDGHPYRFLLDTGSARSAVVFDGYTATFDAAEKNNSSGVFARSSEDLITVPSLEVGPISKQNVQMVRVTGQHPHPRNLIGMDLLKDFCCHFYFDENRVSVNSSEAVASIPALQDLYLDSGFHPYVAVYFGSVLANAVWDTGASITVVDMTFVNAHPSAFESAGVSTGTDATGSQMDTPMFRMAECRIGDYHFPSQRVAGVDLSQVNATIDRPMDLILGYTILSKANWLFDLPRKNGRSQKSLFSNPPHVNEFYNPLWCVSFC